MIGILSCNTKLPTPHEDSALVTAAQLDASKFNDIYRHYACHIYHYFWYRVSHNTEIAEDLTHEVFTRAFKALPAYEPAQATYLTYLYKIAHNTLINYYKSKSTVDLEEAEDVPADEAIDKNFEKKEQAEALWRAVVSLPADEKDALLLFYQSQKSISEIAHIFGRTENAVKLLLSRTRKKLAKHPELADLAQLKVPKQSIKIIKFSNQKIDVR